MKSASEQLSSKVEPKRRHPLLPLSAGLVLVVVCIGGIAFSPTPIYAGIWTLALLLVLMFAGVPIGAALASASICGLFFVSGWRAVINVLSTAPFSVSSNWTMSVLPMFILMGMLLTQSGMTEKIYRATRHWFGWLPGGIAIGTTAAGAGLASVSGSSIGMTYTLARAGLPEMLKSGYDRRVAVGSIIVAGLPGQLIPPSIMLVIYAGIAGVPIGPQLAAGAVPGIAIAVFMGLFLLLLGLASPKLVGKSSGVEEQKVSWSERLKSLLGIWGFPLIMAVLFGGMFSGTFTPSEASAAAAMTALLLTFWFTRKDKPMNHMVQATRSTVGATASIFFLLIGAEILTRVLSVTGLAQAVTDGITSLGLSRIGLLLLLVVLYIIMGMFFDTMSMLLLTIPILLPTLSALEIDPLFFGVFVVLLCELGMITPPVGVLCYLVHNIAKNPKVNLGVDISLKDVFVSLLWFLPIVLLFIIILIFVPDIALWLPSIA